MSLKQMRTGESGDWVIENICMYVFGRECRMSDWDYMYIGESGECVIKNICI